MPSLQPKCAEPVAVNIKAFSHIDLKQKRKPSIGGCLHHNKMKTKLITVIKHLQDPTSVVRPHGCCQVVIMSMQCLWMTQATSMTQRVFSSLPLKLHVNVWLCPTYKSFWASCISVSWYWCLDEPWGKTWQNMAKHGKTWQNPRLESACSMHCHCFSPFLPWQSAQTYQLQSWRTVPAKSGGSARSEEWWPASHPKATGLGFSASAPSPALSFFLAAWRCQRTFGTFGTCSKFRG